MIKSDVLVLGGGPGGYLAAERAAQNGKTVTLIERRVLGGTCLNEGCIPSKALLNSAKLYVHAKNSSAFGVTAADVRYDHSTALEHRDGVVKTLVSGIERTMKSLGIRVVKAEGIIKERIQNGFVIGTPEEEYIGSKLILACGSEPVIPPIQGLREGLARGYVMTNREILERKELPEQMVIIGGGVIGLEMAACFGTVGVKVTVIEMLDKIAGQMDREISAQLQKEYSRRGIEFRLSAKVIEIGSDCVIYEDAQGTHRAEADAVLCAIGRRPTTNNIGLESIGVYTEQGHIVTDDHMQTNIPGVYAVGDVNGKVMLAHAAYREAEVAVNHILGKKDRMRYDAIPSVIYTDPEVACVGETEESAKKKGMSVKSVKASMRFSGRYLAEVQGGNGFCRLVVDTDRNCIVGAHIIGNYASEMIFGVALMIEKEMRVEHIKELVFPHPTVSEVIREALFMV